MEAEHSRKWKQLMYYHVRITPKSDTSREEVELDLSLDQLEERFLRPYKEGLPIIVSGKVIEPSNNRESSYIDRIQINETQQNSETLNESMKQDLHDRRTVIPLDNKGRLPARMLAAQGQDVTSKFISGSPGEDETTARRTREKSRPITTNRDVFVVHGRNATARIAMYEFLRSIGLRPIEWNEAVSATGTASPYIGQILDAALSGPQAVVVILTPDDEVRLREGLREPGDQPYESELTGQARPNVLFEAGLALGQYPDQTILVEIGQVRKFSDIDGRHIIRMDGSTTKRADLANRLKTAGCPVRLEGTDWLHAGNFESAIQLAQSSPTNSDESSLSAEERRFSEMLVASSQIREHFFFLPYQSPAKRSFEAHNIIIDLGALAGQMNALGMNELNERLATAEGPITKLDQITAMLGYFEMLVIGRKFDDAKQKFAFYNPDKDDRRSQP